MPNTSLSSSEASPDPKLRASLLALLHLMIAKAKEKHLQPTIKTNKIIDLLKPSGITLSYNQLVDLTNDEAIGSMIKDINQEQTTLSLDSDSDDISTGMDDDDESPEV